MESKNIVTRIESSNKEHISAEDIKNKIQSCTDKLNSISVHSKRILIQGGWDAYFNKSNNIRHLAKYVNNVTDVQRETLDLINLLMGASVIMKEDYNFIISVIDELADSNSDNAQILGFLHNIRSSVSSLIKRNEILDSLVTFSNELAETIDKNSEQITDQTEKLEKSLKLVENRFIKEFNSYNEEILRKIDSINEDFNDKINSVSSKKEENFKLITTLKVSIIILFIAIAMLYLVLFI